MSEAWALTSGACTVKNKALTPQVIRGVRLFMCLFLPLVTLKWPVLKGIRWQRVIMAAQGRHGQKNHGGFLRVDAANDDHHFHTHILKSRASFTVFLIAEQTL